MRSLLVLSALLACVPAADAQWLPWRRQIERRLQHQEKMLELLLAQRLNPPAAPQPLPIPGDPRQTLPVPGSPRQALPAPGEPRQRLPLPQPPRQPLPSPGSPKQPLPNPPAMPRAEPPKQSLPQATQPQPYTAIVHAVCRPVWQVGENRQPNQR